MIEWSCKQIAFYVPRRVVRQWKCPEYQRDLEQECWVLMRDADANEGRTGWKLMNWVLLRLKDHMESKQVNYSYQDDVEHLSIHIPLPDELAEDDGFEEHLIDRSRRPNQQVIDKITLEECERIVGEESWEILVLSHTGWTQQEIADIVGVAQQRISDRVATATALLREKRKAGEL